jgi:hypothetical protein
MDVREDVQHELRQALKAAGRRAAILGCRRAAVNFALKTGLAWYADVPLRRVRFRVGPPALLFRAVVAVSSAREPCRLPVRPGTKSTGSLHTAPRGASTFSPNGA